MNQSSLQGLTHTAFLALSLVLALISSSEAGEPDVKPLTLMRSAEVHTEDLPVMKDRKAIRVLTSFSRTNFYIEQGQLSGFEFGLLKEYEKYLNKERSRKELPVVFEFIPLPQSLLLPALKAGYGDIAAAGLTVTEARMEEAAFTKSYLSGISEIVIGHAEAPPIHTLDELSGRDVMVRPSSSYFESLLTLNESLKHKGLPLVRILEADETLATEDILEIVNCGVVPYTVADSHIAEHWLPALSELRSYPQAALRRDGRIAWMVRRNNPKLLADLNAFIDKHKKGTKIGNILFKRHFSPTSDLKNPVMPEDNAKREKFVSLFKKFGLQYGIDWKLVAAQAYQESGFDHGQRSPAGAIGIMQIMPSLAEDPRVGIADITSVEGNIHAGVKYLALIRDLYFDEENLSNSERIRFALGAYNAGPTSIRRARDQTEKLGFDPDRWFRNTEYGVLHSISEEPVRYVSNINKYYLIYSLAEAMNTRKQMMKQKLEASAEGAPRP
ncbi:MAG: transporter substrate-binding domain-containing protein [Deltaproteobacteria bacterium]|nr:transporter substrate-binding domain-containing protein [Deltaproteobacteria bacterium]